MRPPDSYSLPCSEVVMLELNIPIMGFNRWARFWALQHPGLLNVGLDFCGCYFKNRK